VSAVDESSGSCATDIVTATLPKLRITETGVTKIQKTFKGSFENCLLPEVV
jgi:hypothetical protein